MKQTKNIRRPARYVPILVLAAALTLTGCGTVKSYAPAPLPESAVSSAGDAAASGSNATQTPEFASITVQDVNGNAVEEDIFASEKLTMVNVWATFCGVCMDELSEFGALAAEYKDSGLQIVGVVQDAVDANGNVQDETVRLAVEQIANTGADYLHILPTADLWQTRIGQVTAVPTTFFVDADGNVLGEEFIGRASDEVWRQRIEDTLAGLA